MNTRTTILCVIAFAGFMALTVGHADSDVRTVASADGVAVQYEVSGSSEPTLLLVHGWTNNRTFWEPHTTALARSKCVVVVDLPGFGNSGVNRESWTMEAYGQDVAAVIRSLPNTRFVLAQPICAPRRLLHGRTGIIDPTVYRRDPGIAAAINASEPPTNLAAWQQLVPGFKLAAIEGVGHPGVIWEKTDEFDAQLLEFVEGFAQ